MSMRIGNRAKGMMCGGWRLRTSLMACIGAAAFLFCLAPSEVRAQAPAAGETSQEAVPDGQATTSNVAQHEAERPADTVSERQKRLAEDKARLLKLATELKNEIDKAGTAALSVGAIRKADEIEKLARTIRQAMNHDLGQTH